MSRNKEEIDILFSEWDKPDSPGCALAIIKDGEIIYKRGYGMANLEFDIPIAPTTVFDIGSTSKQFTAMCVVLLARQGKLSLDDDIREHLPEFPQYERSVSISHLIHHTSGIRDYLTLMDLAGMQYENEYPDNEIIDLICRQEELNFLPGEEFLYSNSGYVLLAEIVKRVSGISLRSFAEEWIFAPLGMKNTHFHDDFTEIVKNRATGYSPKDENGYQICMSIFDIVGDGCVYTTVEDLYLWDQNFYHNMIGGYGDDLIKEITTPGKLNNGELLEYAFGLELGEMKGNHAISHGGGWAGYRSDMIRFPEARISVICLSNCSAMNPSKLVNQVAELYLPDGFVEHTDESVNHDEIVSIEPPITEIENRVGFYRNQKTGSIWEFMSDDGKLFTEVFGMKFQLAPINSLSFQAVDFPYTVLVEFDRHNANEPNQIQISVDGRSPESLLMIQTDETNEAELQECVGTFYSAEIDVSYNLKLKDEKLILVRKGAAEEILTPINRNLLKGKFISIQFVRNEDLEIVGFSLGAGRVTNLRFAKQ